MPENEILDEIHRHREELSREHDFDVDKLFQYYRVLQNQRQKEGWAVVQAPGEAETSKVAESPGSPPTRT